MNTNRTNGKRNTGNSFKYDTQRMAEEQAPIRQILVSY